MAEDLFAVPRHHMVRDQLKPVGVTQESILAAFGGVPREAFVSEVSLPLAYADVRKTRGACRGAGYLVNPTATL
jgi:protein-L-isoaspartate O-methyltransferase